jgi:hypothetical protein
VLRVVRSVLAIGIVCGAVAPAVAGTSDQPTHPAAGTLVYLNRAPTLVGPAAVSDSTASPLQSSLVGKPVTTSGWPVDAQTWATALQCVQQTWARFDVAITDQAPPAGTPHVEVLVGGSPFDIATNPAFTGVAPMQDDCSVVTNPVVFVFPTPLYDDPILTCGIISQETAHTFGLDHELLAGDPMSYLPFVGQRAFQDQLVSCGEETARQCGPTRACGEKQNSVQMLAQRVGYADGQSLGTIAFTAPLDKAIVPEVFEVAAIAMAAQSPVTGAHLYIDGEAVQSQPGPGPFSFHTPSLSNGQHELDIVADAGEEHFETSELVNVQAGANDANALGCNSGGAGGAGAVLVGLGFVLRRRRR